MSSSSTFPDPVKLQKFRERLHEEWTGDRTVAAWRKWHDRIAAYSRGATEAIREAALLRPGLRVLDLASGVGDPALSIASEVGPTGRVTATDIGPGMISLAGHWSGPPEEYWEQFSEVAAPFRPLIEQLTPEKKTQAVSEILAALRKFWNGKELNMPLEIVIGTGTRS